MVVIQTPVLGQRPPGPLYSWLEPPSLTSLLVLFSAELALVRPWRGFVSLRAAENSSGRYSGELRGSGEW